jgi:hypothetical protein
LFLLLVAAGLPLHAAEECARTFATAPHYTMGWWHPFVAADLDGDGRTEIVMPGTFQEIVAARYANGGFDQKQVLASFDQGTVDAVAADVDGDGRTDIVALVGKQLISVIAAGDGMFRTVNTPLANVSVLYGHLVTGDFDGDGRVDIAVLDEWELWFQIAFGSGDGRFTVRAPTPLPRRMTGAAVVDMDDNGKADLVIVDGVELAVYADGNTRDVRMTAAQPANVVVADFDLDGRNDLVVGNATGASVFLSSEAFVLSGTVPLPLGTENTYGTLLAADFTGDGRPDIAAFSVLNGDVTLLIANEDGTFSTGRSFAISRWSALLNATAGDFDGDGDQDLARSGVDDFQIAFNRGDGVFDAAPSYATRADARGIATGDLNHDGRDDLIVLGSGLDVRVADSGGLLGEPRRVALPNGVAAGVIGDFNEDGHPDLFTAGIDMFLAGKGDGTFQVPLEFPYYPRFIRDIAKGDMNNDGRIDVVVAYDIKRIAMYLSRGDGTFERSEYLLDGYPRRVKLRDINEDGFLDVVLAAADLQRTPSIMLLPGYGGTLGSMVNAGVELDEQCPLEVFDTDGDGHLDIVSVTGDNDALLVLHGRGDGTFHPKRIPYDFFGSWGIAAADLTGDGITDLVLGTSGSGELLAMEGDGKGGFTEIWRELTRWLSPELTIGDFNGDGLGEVAQFTLQATTNRLQIFPLVCAASRSAPPVVRLTVEKVTAYEVTLVVTLSVAAEGAMVQLYGPWDSRITARIANGEARFVISPDLPLFSGGQYHAYFLGEGRLTRARSNTVFAQPPSRQRAARH